MPRIIANHYVLAVHDVAASARFYQETLGFEEFFSGADWIFLKRDNCMIMLGECPEDIHPSKLGCHNYFAYLVVDDADAFYRRLQRKGVELSQEIEDKPWDMREFGIRTIDGHRIMIGQSLEPTS